VTNFYLLINLLIFLLQNYHYITIIIFILCHVSQRFLSIVGIFNIALYY